MFLWAVSLAPGGQRLAGHRRSAAAQPENRMAPPGTSPQSLASSVHHAPRRRSAQRLLGRWHSLAQESSAVFRSGEVQKYRNPRILVCVHGLPRHPRRTDRSAGQPRGLVAPIDDNSLCLKCHDLGGDGPGAANHKLHTLAASFRPEAPFRCVNCHMDLVAKTSAGSSAPATPRTCTSRTTFATTALSSRVAITRASPTTHLDDASKGKGHAHSLHARLRRVSSPRQHRRQDRAGAAKWGLSYGVRRASLGGQRRRFRLHDPQDGRALGPRISGKKTRCVAGSTATVCAFSPGAHG